MSAVIEMLGQAKWAACARGYALRRHGRRSSQIPPFGRHFQGDLDHRYVPGLKTWAVLFDHFMVKKRASALA